MVLVVTWDYGGIDLWVCEADINSGLRSTTLYKLFKRRSGTAFLKKNWTLKKQMKIININRKLWITYSA